MCSSDLRIAAILTTFELNSSSITQSWIENKFYSLDEERISNFRNRIRENVRFSQTKTKETNNNTSNNPSKKIRCKYCYRLGHTDSNCNDKSRKRPPSMPEWVSKIRCSKCKKSGHLLFNCPPKYKHKIRKLESNKPNDFNKTKENAAKATEFAGSVTHVRKCDINDAYYHINISQKSKNHKNGNSYRHRTSFNSDIHRCFLYHKLRVMNINRQKKDFWARKIFSNIILYYTGSIYDTIMKEIRRLSRYDITTQIGRAHV